MGSGERKGWVNIRCKYGGLVGHFWMQLYTLSSQTQNIFEEMSKIREKAGLPNNEEFPMMSFTAMVKYLLCDIAGKDPTFNGFSQDDINRAFKASGFLELELVRCGFRSKEII